MSKLIALLLTDLILLCSFSPWISCIPRCSCCAAQEVQLLLNPLCLRPLWKSHGSRVKVQRLSDPGIFWNATSHQSSGAFWGGFVWLIPPTANQRPHLQCPKLSTVPLGDSSTRHKMLQINFMPRRQHLWVHPCYWINAGCEREKQLQETSNTPRDRR